ncbi:MAG: SUMF1/EgtB/PvdO family nonheme iron enzyme [Deltaproteobacteria bacterium]|nr:SUMF1/EgtB/PvdO family nonheme iron enzyme [Deltaproteobacteria bacterium]
MSNFGPSQLACARWIVICVALSLGAGCARRSGEILLPTMVDTPDGGGGVYIDLDARGNSNDVWPVRGYDGPAGCTGTVELCNGIDDDCDGVIDNGFDLSTDSRNCGACGIVCSAPTATAACLGGQCVIASCTPGYFDTDGNPANGCECMLSNGGVEICDGADNDCDGIVDDGFDLLRDATNCGACGVVCSAANAIPFCAEGTCGFTCTDGYFDVDRKASDGCEYRCTKTADPAETCDGLDNDCNGLFDGEDPGLVYPGGDRTCYSSASGTCQAGELTCIAGNMTCVGAGPPSEETCDGRDNNCDGRVDEADPNLGKPCYPLGVSGCEISTGLCRGACQMGAYVCQDGGLACGGAVTPSVEACDGADNDCDGVVDNGIDLESDPMNCGGCGHVCNFPNAFAACVAGVCVLDQQRRIGACALGWVDRNANPADGCEYQCTATGPETCDGTDNDCNGLIDNEDPGLVYPSNFCLQFGECGKGPGGSTYAGWQGAATFPVCAVPVGSSPDTAPAWICNYPATVQLAAVNQVVPQETWCDGLDNDCNGVVDDPYRAVLGEVCADPASTALGACRRQGTWQCDGGTRELTCDFGGAVAASPADETCDGIDNDCDGLVDESWDNPAGLPQCNGHDCLGVRDDVVHVSAASSPYFIYTYEASRPDAGAVSQGMVGTRACSRAFDSAGGRVLPWSNVTWNQADAACRAAGMRLCRTTRVGGAVVTDEWGFACQAGQTCAGGTYPYNTSCTYGAATCNGIDANQGKVVGCGSLSGCVTVGDLDTGGGSDQVFDLSGNLAEWTDDRRDILDTGGSPPGAGTPAAIYTTRGGAFDSFFRGLACDFMSTELHPTFAFADTGFRCCSSCPPGQADCAGICANLASDSANCGGCQVACGGGTSCQNGVCR